MKRLLAASAALLLAACASIPPAAAPPTAPVEVQILGINDFHGNLEPPRSSIDATLADGTAVKVPAGGVAHLATAARTLRSGVPFSVTVSAGDMIGASPLVSSLFLDEPTIRAMERVGVEYNAVGNHEFDRGSAELKRIQEGGCEKHTTRSPCAVEPFTGARFRFLAANVLAADGSTLFPGTGLKDFGPVQVGFIGMTLKDTATLVTPAGVAGLKFADEAVTANAGFMWAKGALDFAGGTVVHINAGVAGLVGAYLVGKRIGYGKESLTPHSLTLTMVGASLLWVGWFGFNAGSNLEANGVAALAFVNRVASVAEEQGHHPDIYLAWGKVRLTVWTHKIDGLHETDFVFAAKASRYLTHIRRLRRPRESVDYLLDGYRRGLTPNPDVMCNREMKFGVFASYARAEGFTALEALAAPRSGSFLFGNAPTLADICLVPQMYNARRFDVSLDAFPTLVRADSSASALPAFADAHPGRQEAK
mgnify:CR=1 FL=1